MKKITDFLRKIFYGITAKRNLEQAIENKIDQISTPMAIAQRKIFMEKVARYEAKEEKLGRAYTDRLNEHLNTYFNNFDQEDAGVNKFAYDLINKEWKSYCQRVNASQKLLFLKADRFEFEVARIVSENVQFQLKETVTTIN